MNKCIAYYHPREISPGSDRASSIRVERMLDAFTRTGHKVILLAGNAAERHRRIRQFKTDIAAGLRVDFVYAETTNAPIALAEKKLFPINSIADYAFFAWLKKSKIPSGVFYRDIFWRFDFFKLQLPKPLSVILKPLYYLDWYMYHRYWDTFFLPSLAMNDYLPIPRLQNKFAALPPGYDPSCKARSYFSEAIPPDPLNLLYVGGIEPSVYDITEILSMAKRQANIRLTICCREDEWRKYAYKYTPLLNDRVDVVHRKGEQLQDCYHHSDLFMMLMPPQEYLSFAAPVKFYESIGYAVPMISMNLAIAEQAIRKHDIGWVVESVDEIDGLLEKLFRNRSQLQEKHQNLLEYRKDCSWDSRARTAEAYLLSGRKR